MTSRGICFSTSLTPLFLASWNHEVLKAHLPFPAQDVQFPLLHVDTFLYVAESISLIVTGASTEPM